jgi:hypothetical protein
MKFNPVLGSWQLYLVLGLATEFAVVLLYTMSGILNSFAKSRDTALGYEGIAVTSWNNDNQAHGEGCIGR